MKGRFIRRMSIAMAISLSTVLAIATPGSASATPGLEGTVFEDSNGDGIRNGGEVGIPDILVSNGVAVTVTDGTGAYSLPMEGYFVFITTPSEYTPTTPWYRSAEGNGLDFGLAYTPEKATDEFVFVQITDAHIDTVPERVALFQQDVAEINNIDDIFGIGPAFVIDTGDLVSRGDEVSIAQASQWFDVYSSVTSGFDMPLYTAPGNHDVVGINNPDVDPTEPGYNKEMYRDYLGPPYYSFDWGSYHCLVLDANEFADGRQFYGIADQQVEWLQQDLAQRQGWPLLVFYHEQTPSWENRTEVWGLLTQHGEMTAFLGHLHHDILMIDSESQGIPEQVTGAVCGEWWFGPGLDGRPRGYRIISVDAEGFSSFYKEAGAERQVNITSPDVIVSGQATLTAQVYTEYGAVTGVSYQVDGGGLIPMSTEVGGLWDTATAVWDTTLVEQGYHTITIEATDGIGTFSTEKVFNVTEEETVPLGELVAHYEAYLGQYTNVTGEASFVVAFAEDSTAVIMGDGTGAVVVLAQSCVSPPLPALAEGDTIRARAVPLKYSWDFLTLSPRVPGSKWDLLEYYVENYPEILPPGFLVTDEYGDPIEIRLVTLLSAADIPNIKATAAATGTGVVSFSTISGTIENVTAVPESSLPSEGKPDLQFPHGFFSFDITGLSIGETVVVTVHLPSAVPVGTQYWKYHASEGGWIRIPMGSDDGDNVITITLVDGGLGDDDGVADGTIVDQGGPGNPPPAPSGVPVFPTVLGGIAAAVAAGFVAFAVRRRILSQKS